MRRHPFAAVNFISDPIHGYVELTKRLTRDESTGAGLPEGGCGAQKMNPFWLFIFALHVKIVNPFLLAFLDGFCVPPKR